MSKLALLGEFLIAPSAPAQGQIIYLAGGNLYVKDSTGKETRLDAIDPLGSIAVGPETVTVNGSGTMAFIDVPQIFVDDQEIDALLGVNAAPSTDAQVEVVSGAAGRRALRVKAATSPTVPAFELLDSTAVARHQLWADYSTNIRAARLMGTYQEYLIQPGTIVGTSPGPAQTLTVTIVGTVFPRQAVYVEAIGTFFNSADGTTTRAMFIDDVTFSTRLNSSTPATIGVNTRRGSDINGVTVTGPTAVNGGISYTVSNAATNLQRAAMMVRIQSSQFVTVTASVA